MKHKHAELIHAWADGAEIEYRPRGASEWTFMEFPSFDGGGDYRIKPQPVIEERYIGLNVAINIASSVWGSLNDVDNWDNILKLTLADGKLTNVEITK